MSEGGWEHTPASASGSWSILENSEVTEIEDNIVELLLNSVYVLHNFYTCNNYIQ